MLNLKHIAVSSFNENIAFVHKDCAAYKVDDIKFDSNFKDDSFNWYICCIC